MADTIELNHDAEIDNGNSDGDSSEFNDSDFSDSDGFYDDDEQDVGQGTAEENDLIALATVRQAEIRTVFVQAPLRRLGAQN